MLPHAAQPQGPAALVCGLTRCRGGPRLSSRSPSLCENHTGGPNTPLCLHTPLLAAWLTLKHREIPNKRATLQPSSQGWSRKEPQHTACSTLLPQMCHLLRTLSHTRAVLQNNSVRLAKPAKRIKCARATASSRSKLLLEEEGAQQMGSTQEGASW